MTANFSESFPVPSSVTGMVLSTSNHLILCLEAWTTPYVYTLGGNYVQNLTGASDGFDVANYKGNIIISNNHNVLFAFDSSYNFINKVETSQIKLGIAVWGDSMWLAVATFTGWIQQYTIKLDGTFSVSNSKRFGDNLQNLDMNTPRQIVTNGLRIAVAVFNSNQVHVFSISGLYMYTVKSGGGVNLHYPVGVALDNNNVLYISDTFNHRIVVVSADGQSSKTLLSASDGIKQPWALLILNDTLYVSTTHWNYTNPAGRFIKKYMLSS